MNYIFQMRKDSDRVEQFSFSGIKSDFLKVDNLLIFNYYLKIAYTR
jgi:hypothetical protein